MRQPTLASILLIPVLFVLLGAKPPAGDETVKTDPANKGTPAEKAKAKTEDANRAKQPPPASVTDLHLKPPAGFDLTLFATPPDAAYPTCLAATPNGEVFVGCDELGSTGKGEGRGKIIRCVDTDGDGKADKITVFAKIDHPRGLFWDNGKLFVLHPPTLSVYYDVNNDGVSDRSEDLIQGISTEGIVAVRGADHTTNGIRMAIDGWLYIAVGDFGCKNAIGKDGTKLYMHGGGVVRVRPDGSGLENYCFGTRNIYDVAIDPLMNIFARDNTNDGDGWNDKLDYVVPSGNFGYPRLFRHFPDEIVPHLIDFGGGSPTGSLFVDEPAIPGEFGHGLFTVEWGRNYIDRHPLTATGAGFSAITKKFMDLPRGTDIDVDGRGRFFISSWSNGTFDFTGPNVGYVIRLSPTGAKPREFPDIAKATDEQLFEHLASPSGVCRLAAQREIIRRGDRPAFLMGLPNLAGSEAPLSARVAAIFTFRQVAASKSNEPLTALAAKDDLREFALRALADRKSDTDVPLAPFVGALKDSNPRVRLIAAWCLGRLGRMESATALLPLLADADPLVAHVTVNSLTAMHATDACLSALDDSTPTLAAGAVHVLQLMHEVGVIDGLVARQAKVTDPVIRASILRALCRLYFRESEWDGKWWSIRPDTTGPYYGKSEWEGTPRVRAALLAALGNEKADLIRGLLGDLQRNHVEIKEASQAIAKAAANDPALRAAAIDALDGKVALNPDEIGLAAAVARSEKEPAAVRTKAVRSLTRAGGVAGLDAAVEALAPVVAKETGEGENASLDEFIREPRHAQNVGYFKKLVDSDDPAKRELAWSVLTSVAGSKLTTAKVRTQASSVIDAGWAKPATVMSLLHAVARTRAEGYRERIEALAKDPNPEVAKAAGIAADRLGLKAGVFAPAGDLIESVGFDQTVARVTQAKGDAKLGKDLFTRQGCIACHTLSADEPPKGPMLAGIAARYSRTELCESIMKPSAKIAQGFETQWFKTRDGDEIEGFVVRESGEEVEVRNIAAISTVIKKDNIKQRGKRDTSIMPEGLVTKLTPEQLAGLIAYLESLKGK